MGKALTDTLHRNRSGLWKGTASAVPLNGKGRGFGPCGSDGNPVVSVAH